MCKIIDRTSEFTPKKKNVSISNLVEKCQNMDFYSLSETKKFCILSTDLAMVFKTGGRFYLVECGAEGWA